MATSIDSLGIQISAQVTRANKSIDNLVSKLNTLSASLGKINGSSLTGLANGVQKLGTAMQSIKNVNSREFSQLASNISKLSSIDTSGLNKVSSSLNQFSNSIRNLSSDSGKISQISSLSNAISRLGSENATKTTENLPKISNDLQSFVNGLNGIEALTFDANGLSNLISSIGKLGSKSLTQATANLPSISRDLQSFVRGLNEIGSLTFNTQGISELLSSISKLGGKAATNAVSNIPNLAKELKNFMETMSNAPNVSRSVIDMTNALARLARTGASAGRAADALGKSFNSAGDFASIFRNKILSLSSGINIFGKSSAKALNGIKSLTKQILAAAGIAYGLRSVFNGIRKSIDISSDLTEVQNVVDVTFGNMAYKVEEFAKTSVEQFGMSELTLKEVASRFQAIGSAMTIDKNSIKSANEFLNKQTNGYVALSDSMSDVSMNLTKLTADMASFYNVEQEEVAEDLAAIFTGQTVPLRRYGLDLTQATLQEWALKEGLDADIQSMTQAEKTMLRYQYVLANMGAAQGDFARTANTWANQTRILRQNLEQLASTIGGVLINALKPLVRALNVAMGYINSFALTVSNALGKIFGWTYEDSGGGATLPDDFESAAESADDLADSTGKTAKNIKNIQKGLRAGIDELKLINLPEDTDSGSGKGSGSGSGVSGSGAAGGQWTQGDSIFKQYESEIDSLYKLGKYIGDALAKAMDSIDWDKIYKKARNFGKGLADFLNGLISPGLFSALGKTIAGSINTALHFLDSFGETFNFRNFGKSIGAGINSALQNIDWSTALSAAKNWGIGIGNAINSFLHETDFSLIGSTVANALNTAVQFALNLGTTINFKQFGDKIADAVNGFFNTFGFSDLANAINTWVNGILDAIIRFIDKTNWNLIGEEIGKFTSKLKFAKVATKVGKAIWKAINAAIKSLGSMFKAAPIETIILSAISLNKLLKLSAVTAFASKIKSAVTTITTFKTALGGSETALATLTTQFPKTTKVVTTLKDSFDLLKMGIADGQFLEGLKLGIDNIRNNLSGLAKGVITAAAAFGEFKVISNVFEGLIKGNENLLSGIGKIGAAAALAAGAMYVALGPAGLAIAAVTGLVAAFQGFRQAMEEIKAEVMGQAIHDALSAPGGVSITELTGKVTDSIRNIGSEFSALSEKSNELDAAEKNIEDIKTQIELVEEKLNAGVITSEEAKTAFLGLLDELNTAAQSKFEALNGYIVSAFGENGTWSKAFESAGVDVSNMVATTLQLTDSAAKRFSELTQEMSTLDPTSPKYQELQAEMYGLLGQTDSLETALKNFDLTVSSLDIDYSGLVTKDGELDTEAVENAMADITSAVNDANSEIDTAGQEMQQTLTDLLNAAKTEGNQEAIDYYDKLLQQLPEVISTQKKEVAIQGKELTDELQTGLVDKIKQVGQDAYDSWDELADVKKAGFTNATAYADEMIRKYVEEIITPFSQSVEENFDALGVDGAGWSEEAAKQASEGFTNYDWFETFGDNMSSEDLSGVLNSVVDDAMKDVIPHSEKEFKKAGKNSGEGFEDGINDSKKGAAVAAGTLALDALKQVKSKLGIASPSKEFKKVGGFVTEGLKLGISDKWKDFSADWTKKYNSIIDTFKNIKEKFLTKGKDIMSGIKSGISEKWGDFNEYWEKKKDAVIDKFKDIKEKFNTKGNNIISGIKSGIGEKWSDFNSYWSDKKTSVVDKFKDIKDKFASKGKDIVSGLQSGISDNWSSFIGWMGEKLKGLVNGILKGINWVLEKVGSKTRLSEWSGFAKGSKGLPKDTIGIVNDQKGSTYREMIVPPNGKPFIPEGRNVMLPMKKGTKIMPADETKKFLMNMPHFASGIGDFFSGVWAKVTSFTGNIMDYLSEPSKILQIAVDKFTDMAGFLEPALSIAKGAASTLVNGAVDFIKKIFDEELTVHYDPSKGVEQWRGLAQKALEMTHQFTQANLNAMMYRMNVESSGNPKAINLWDSNAKKGTPSKGLMQVIDPTFRSYAFPGYDKDIWDPLSNMLASIRYALANYHGSLLAAYYRKGGYAKGIGKIGLSDIVTGYAVGGFPEPYSLFAAGEGGRTELLGTVGGQTAVAGGAEITGIRDAVITSHREEMQILREQNNLLRGILQKEFGITESQIGKASVNYIRGEERRLQRSIVGTYV